MFLAPSIGTLKPGEFAMDLQFPSALNGSLSAANSSKPLDTNLGPE
jgi:hypothetical protein